MWGTQSGTLQKTHYQPKRRPSWLCDPFYSVDSYRLAYECAIMPMSGDSVWEQTSYVPPLPHLPSKKKGRGRPISLRRREPDEPRGKRKRSTCPFKLKKQQTTVRCSKCHATGHNALRCKVTAAQQQEANANANANIPMRREKLKVTKKNTDEVGKSCHAPQQQQEVHATANILPPRENDLTNSVISDEELMAAIDNYTEMDFYEHEQPQPQVNNQSKRGVENSHILPPTQEDLMDSVISDQELMAAVESQVDSNIYQYVQPHKLVPSPSEQLRMSTNEPPVINPLHTKLNIRAPPPITGGYSRPLFSTKPNSSKSIVVEGGKKFMNLSQESQTGVQMKKGKWRKK
ncbi:phosphoserine aminotransferase [Striga asiatica]|uniref:Phosphoserine aminotransferase n=1 Tax=Striga asiatica TaxID=4170 RepID=A0A5A7NZA8_STRAF|nr:phosphoserine aminotransferase [Striga asiatica]